jgi:hypothetical protein
MPVSNQTNRWSYTATAGQTTFPYDNLIFAATDLKVLVDGVLLLAGYSVTGVLVPTGGNVVLDTGLDGGESVVLFRDVPAIQDVDYIEGDGFPADAHERAIDRLTVLVQQLYATQGRSLRLASTDPAPALLELPLLEQLKGATLGFDPVTGAPIAVAAQLGEALVSAFVQTLLMAADAATLRSLIGVVFGTGIGNALQVADVSGVPGLPALDGSQLTNIGSSFPLGTVLPVVLSTIPDGWLLLNGDTIGSAASAATHKDDAYETFWKAYYADYADSEAPVVGGRGASADADWTANKAITLPDVRSRNLIGAGAGTGLTERVAGTKGGAETHTLTAAQSGLPAHSHQYTRYLNGWAQGQGDSQPNVWFSVSTQNTGNNAAQNASQSHPIMDPWLALPFIVRVK